MTPLELTGRARTHLIDVTDPSCTLHVHATAAFQQLRSAAAADGFDLRPVSSFRDFVRQLAIWNEKYAGTRPLYDADGRRLDVLSMTPEQRITAILRWSALPGASRHHWGTDVDLIDAAALEPNYRVQLTAAEFAEDGPFARMSGWLEAHAARFGFFRPFRGNRSGVQAEPWHFSFAPIAEFARKSLTINVLHDALADSPLAGKDHVLSQLDVLHARYVASIDLP